MIDTAITELTPLVGVRAACVAVGRPRASHYRRHRKSAAPPRPPRPERPTAERANIRTGRNSEPERVSEQALGSSGLDLLGLSAVVVEADRVADQRFRLQGSGGEHVYCPRVRVSTAIDPTMVIPSVYIRNGEELA